MAKKAYPKPTIVELKEKLSSIEFDVTQNDATEPAFKNKYWNHKEHGTYVDVVSGEPLFTSKDKFDSGCGWPSFTKPITDENIKNKIDTKFGMVRTEVRSVYGDSHLGHVFDDGPGPTGLRYCINSASIRFIPVGQLQAQGYEEFINLFSDIEE